MSVSEAEADGALERATDNADLIAALTAERDKLQAFKDWVHGYLDAKGVPHHPPGTHGAEGCRVGDRMDWLTARLASAEAERDRLQAAAGAVVGYAVVLTRPHRYLPGPGQTAEATALHFLERFWVADAVDVLGARQRALDAAARLAGHLQPGEEAFVSALTRVEG